MKSDKWITVKEAREQIEKHPDVVETRIVHVKRKGRGVEIHGINEHGAAVKSKHIFDGTEHPLAQKGMVLDKS